MTEWLEKALSGTNLYVGGNFIMAGGVPAMGGAANTNASFRKIVGIENVLAIDDVCGL